MLYSAVLFQQAHGLIELYFHVFAALALLLAYRDWRVLIAGAATIALHHFAFNSMQNGGAVVIVMNYPGGTGMVLLHAAFVIFETAALVILLRIRNQRRFNPGGF